MTSSKRVYISSAEEEVIPFSLDDLLNREVDQRFEEAAWRLADDDVVFEPLAIKTLSGDQLDRLNRGEAWEDEPTDDTPSDGAEALDVSEGAAAETEVEAPDSADQGEETSTLEQSIEPDPEWLESQLALARADAEVALRVEYDAKIAELEQALQAKDAERFQALAETEARMREEAAREMAEAKRALTELTARVTEASQQVGQFFEPLSRLAIHVASQLVRGELTLNSTAIARLVQGCLDHLEGQIPNKPPVLRLHPDDLEHYLQTLGGSLDGLEVRADPSLARGDVSIQMNDSAIEDLIQHRLDRLVAVIFGAPQPWAQSMFTEPAADEGSEWQAQPQARWPADDETVVDWEPVDEVKNAESTQPDPAQSASQQDENPPEAPLDPTP